MVTQDLGVVVGKEGVGGFAGWFYVNLTKARVM